MEADTMTIENIKYTALLKSLRLHPASVLVGMISVVRYLYL